MIPSSVLMPAYRWLVGRSYRVVYRQDPSPSRANRAVMHSLVHVHGAIYIASDRAEPGKQPSEARAHGGCEADHDFERYAEAMYAAVDRHLEEMAAFRGEFAPSGIWCGLHVALCSPPGGQQLEDRGCIRRSAVLLSSVHLLASVCLTGVR